MLQLCLTLCDPTDCSLPGSTVHGILQARILEWVAISFSRGSSQPRVEPRSPALQADSLPTELQGKPHFVLILYSSFPGGSRGKEPTCQCRRPKRFRFDPWVGKIPWKRAWQLTPVFLPGEPHGQRGLVGYCPRGDKELDTTEAT